MMERLTDRPMPMPPLLVVWNATNIRSASVLGLIGAGGIGYLMSTSFRTFQYQEAAAIVLVLIGLVMLVDYLSSRLRNWVV